MWNQRRQLRKRLKKLPPKEQTEIIMGIADKVLDSSEQGDLVREMIEKVDVGVKRVGPVIATEIVTALAMFLDEAM